MTLFEFAFPLVIAAAIGAGIMFLNAEGRRLEVRLENRERRNDR